MVDFNDRWVHTQRWSLISGLWWVIGERERFGTKPNYFVFFSDKLLEFYPPFRNYISVLNAFSPWFHLISPKQTHGRFGWRSLRVSGTNTSQAFNTAIEGNSFQDAVKAWASCSRGLKQARVWRPPRAAVPGWFRGKRRWVFCRELPGVGDSCFGKHRKNGGSSQRWSKIKIEIYLWRFWLNLMIDQEYLQCSNAAIVLGLLVFKNVHARVTGSMAVEQVW